MLFGVLLPTSKAHGERNQNVWGTTLKELTVEEAPYGVHNLAYEEDPYEPIRRSNSNLEHVAHET